ncbi:MAG: DUF169 domain-containing protein [Chloroflexia bacterium]
MEPGEASAALERYLRPASFPVGLKLLDHEEEIPARVRRPLRDLGIRVATCQLWAIARRYGWTLGATREDLACPPGKIVLGLEPAVPYYLEGHVCEGMYTATAEAGARTEAETPRFPYGQHRALLAAPLARMPVEPDVVLVYGNPAQMVLLVAAALYRQGGRLEGSFSARLDCADILPGTLQAGRPQVILPCYGDRIFGQTQDHEMAFALPAEKLPHLLEGLEGLHQGGVRYPIPSFLRYAPRFPESYEQLEALWAQGRASAEPSPER